MHAGVGFRIVFTGMAISLGLSLSLMSGCTARQSTGIGTSTTNGVVVQPNAVVGAEPGWFACKVDSNCQVVRGVCGEPQAVNTSFLEPFGQYRDKMSQMVDCATPSKALAPSAARCMQQRCLVIPAGKVPPKSHESR